MSLATTPAPLTSPAEGRDPSHVTREYIQNQIHRLRITDSEIQHDFQALNQHYPNGLIDIYDITPMGHVESAELLASRIPASLVVSNYLDIGWRTGMTTLAYTKKVLEKAHASGTTIAIRVIDGLEKMATLAVRKITVAAGNNPTFLGISQSIGDIIGDANCLSSRIPRFQLPSLCIA